MKLADIFDILICKAIYINNRDIARGTKRVNKVKNKVKYKLYCNRVI